MKNRAFPNGRFCIKSRKCRIHQREAREAPLHSLIANHVLEMSMKLKFQCRLEKNHFFGLVVLNPFPICFSRGLFPRCDLYHRILLYYYAETNGIIYESVNLKGVV